MKSKNKRIARPPPTKPWMLDNTSSSRLKNMEIGLPPPAAVAAYQTKPLPPIPSRRSGISRFSTELKNALRTPTTVNYHTPPELRPDAREASIAVVLKTANTKDAESPVKRVDKVDSGCTFTESQIPDSHSLLPTGSVQKLLQITGAGSTASLALSNTNQTPAGHNSARKVKQVMGVDVPIDESHGSRGLAQEISPLSPDNHSSSSIYSQYSDISDPETESRFDRGQLSTPDTARTVSKHSASTTPSWQSSPVPASLHIVKSRGRNTFVGPLSPLNELASPTNNYSHTNGGFKKDLYHTTVSELAQTTSSSSTHTQASGTSSSDEKPDSSSDGVVEPVVGRHHAFFHPLRPTVEWEPVSSPGFPILHPLHPIAEPVPVRNPGCFHPALHPIVEPVPERHLSFSNRAYQSKVRIAPPLRKLDTQSATRYNAPVKTPYPLPPSKFELDDDDNDVTPTQRDYDHDGNATPQTAVRRPSLTSRLARRISTSLSPTSPPGVPEHTPTLPPGFSTATSLHPSALPSPLHLGPPRRLNHRHMQSQDSSSGSRPTTVFSNAASTNYTAPTSRNVSPNPTSRAATPMPGNYGYAPTRPERSITPNGQPTNNTTSHPTPFVPPFRTRTKSKSKTKPPPIPPRGSSPPPPLKPTVKPSLASSAFTSLSSWTQKATDRLEAARQAARIHTPAERRRYKLKSSIRLEKDGAAAGRVEVVPAVPAVPALPVAVGKVGKGEGEEAKKAQVEEEAGWRMERTKAEAPVRVARRVEVYNDERAEAAVKRTERGDWI